MSRVPASGTSLWCRNTSRQRSQTPGWSNGKTLGLYPSNVGSNPTLGSMKWCRQCSGKIPCWIRINGRRHSLKSRRLCLTCLPFKSPRHHPKRTNPCGHCGRPCKRKFCDSKCQADRNRAVRHQALEIAAEVPVGTTDKFVKQYLIKKRGHACEMCRHTIWMGQPMPLILDHIDGNSGNRRLDNLRLVCGNCDMQLPTYKAKNRGRGRFARRQRYSQGKSF